jgi:hypothetical protein
MGLQDTICNSMFEDPNVYMAYRRMLDESEMVRK